MKLKEDILESNGFEFDALKFENEYSAKNLLIAMDEYASQFRQEWIPVEEREQKQLERMFNRQRR